jgi:hypothetical protein
MKNENQSNIDTTGVSEWWFTRNIIVGLAGIVATVTIFSFISPNGPSRGNSGSALALIEKATKVVR